MHTSKIFLASLFVYFSSVPAVSTRLVSFRHCKKCNPNPCLNGGTCDEFKSHRGKSICICPEGFTGGICETDICESHDCQNGACEADKCKERGYKCSCFPGYVGDNCEGGVCDGNNCMDGSCVPDQSSRRGYTCKCSAGFVGENCEVDVCNSHNCTNGICVPDQTNSRGYTCNCSAGFVGENCEGLAMDCKDLFENGQSNSGVYEIFPSVGLSSPVRVLCDMETMGGGWTVIQKRIDGSVGFEKPWEEYKAGFGIPGQEDFWIGNDVIHQLTKGDDSSLYISITLVNGTTLYELYERISVANETEKYQLLLAGNATGTLGDRMLDTGISNFDLSGMFFSTRDRDNDKGVFNCADLFRGGWWFNNCYGGFLNGPWASSGWSAPWYLLIPSGTDVSGTVMMVKRS